MLEALAKFFEFLTTVAKSGRWVLVGAASLITVTVAGKMYVDEKDSKRADENIRLERKVDRKISSSEKTDIKILSGIRALNQKLTGFGTRIDDIKSDVQIMKSDVRDTQTRVLEIYRDRSLDKEGS